MCGHSKELNDWRIWWTKLVNNVLVDSIILWSHILDLVLWKMSNSNSLLFCQNGRGRVKCNFVMHGIIFKRILVGIWSPNIWAFKVLLWAFKAFCHLNVGRIFFEHYCVMKTFVAIVNSHNKFVVTQLQTNYI